MTKIRVTFLIITLLVVSTIAYFVSLYAKGYRFSSDEKKLLPSGLLVAKSNPDGAQLSVNGEVKGATNGNLSLAPGTYDIAIKKEGYQGWSKRLKIEKEVVTEIDANLFKISPSLSPITYSGALDPIPSPDFSKIAFVVPASKTNLDEKKEGLWVIETLNLPIGFTRDPKRITNGNLENSTWSWSPDSRNLLLVTAKGSYILDTSRYTPQENLVNISSTLNTTKVLWEKESENKLTSQLKTLPEEIRLVLESSPIVVFSPDENIVLYKSGLDSTLPDEIIKPVPGASTQKQVRDIKKGNIYTYNIKEDRNFELNISGTDLIMGNHYPENPQKRLEWFPTSRQLVLINNGKVQIIDYDGTNEVDIYSGSFVNPYAFPTLSSDRLLILTNLGSTSNEANIYSLSIK